jgi:hypothetical protein
MKTTIKLCDVYAEGSASMLVDAGAWRFSMHYVFGEIRTTLVGGASCFGNRAINIRKSAQKTAEKLFAAKLAEQTPEWHEAHKALYA